MLPTHAERWLAQNQMTSEPPAGCPWKVGDLVLFVNDYGVIWGPRTVIGFALPGDELNGRTVYINDDSPWFPRNPQSLTKGIRY